MEPTGQGRPQLRACSITHALSASAARTEVCMRSQSVILGWTCMKGGLHHDKGYSLGCVPAEEQRCIKTLCC